VLGHRVVDGRVPVLLLEGVALLHRDYARISQSASCCWM
jgi:hypothetical protein